MEQIVYISLSGVIGGLMGLLTVYVVGKKYFNNERFIDIFYDIIAEVSNNQDLKLQLFQIGGLLGSGVRSGIGIGKKGGKYGLEELATELIGGFARQYLQGMAGQNQPQTVTVEGNPAQIT